MGILRYLARNITVLNLLLAIAIVLGISFVVSPLFSVSVKYSPPPAKKAAETKEASPAPARVPSPLDYAVIADQNLFHPERKIPVEKAAAAPLPKPEFVLYGVLMTDDASIAYMEDKKSPQSTAGRGKRQAALRRGETISGFTLKEIEADKVVMVRGEEVISVSLNDSHTPKEREAAAAPAQPKPGAQPPGSTFQPQPATPATTAPPPSAPQQAAPPPQRAQPGQQPAPGAPQDPRKTFLDFFKKK